VDTLSYKTKSANKATVQKEWFVVDATDQVVGRMCSQIAKIIRGKHKTSFTPNVNCGDGVIVINAEKVKFTGNKMSDKVYIHHTMYPGGQRFATPEDLMAKDPTKIIKNAVAGMLPKNSLGRDCLKNLFVYVGPNHNQEAQQPKELKF
jgi:large subunit ribosomal protein L13